MDGNLSRLYYMLGNYDSPKRGNSERPVVRSEVDTLINGASGVEFPRSHVDGPTGSALIDSEIETATLEITSNTTILNSDAGRVLFKTHATRTAGPPASNSVPPSQDIQAEFHFNPLYTISDGGADSSQQFPSQSSPMMTTNMGHHQMLIPPTNRFGLIYIAFLLAGIGFLLPYNSFVIAADYFQDRFPSTTIVFDMSTTYIIVAFLTVIISNVFVESIPLFWRLNLGYLLSFCIMIFVVLYEIWANLGGYWENLVMIGIAAVGCTIQQSTFYGYTSMLPKKYTQAVMTGESAAGMFVSLNRIITKMLCPQDNQLNTSLFFIVSIVLISVCALVHIVLLPRSDFIRYYLLLRNQRRKSIQNDGARMMHQINENLGLVNMYNNKTTNNNNNNNNSGHSVNNNERQTEAKQGPNEYYVDSIRPSIYSANSNLCLDMIDLNPAPCVTINNRVQNMLRTDSTEFVMPFGIDDEEIAAEQQRQQSRMQSNTQTLLLDNSMHESQDYTSGEFKTKSTTSTMVHFLNWFENVTHSLRYIGMFFRRVRLCDKSAQRCMESLRIKLRIRKSIIVYIWPQILSIMLVYFVTLAIFPGIESEIFSCSFRTWTPIILMATFNITDFIGKLMSTLLYRITGYQLVMISIFRFILLPLFAFCVYPRPIPFFANPIWALLFSTALGLSNGIFGSLPMILAPVNVSEAKREITGNLMTFSYVIGLTTGSFASYIINDIVGGSHSDRNFDYITNCLNGNGTNSTNLSLFSFYYF